MSHFTIKLRQILHKTRDEWAKFAIREMEIPPNTIAKFYGYKSSCDLEQILKQDKKRRQFGHLLDTLCEISHKRCKQNDHF